MIDISFCIPTYNRFEDLCRTLDSFLSQDVNLESIEIVISDNSSSDPSYQQIPLKYRSKFANFVYFRQSSNIGGDKNFYAALSLANGRYLKLWNDTLVLRPNSLQLMIDTVQGYSAFDVCPLFCNGIPVSTFTIDSLELAVTSLKFYITHIQYFGVWRVLLPSLDVFELGVKFKLPHVSALLSLISLNSCHFKVVNNTLWVKSLPRGASTEDYDPFNIFLLNLSELYSFYGLPSFSHPQQWLKAYTLCHLCAPWCILYIKELFSSPFHRKKRLMRLFLLFRFLIFKPLLALRFIIALLFFSCYYLFRRPSLHFPSLYQKVFSFLSQYLLPQG